MNKVQVTLSKKGYDTKPNGGIVNTASNYVTKEVTVRELAEAVAKEGKTVRCSLLGRNASDCTKENHTPGYLVLADVDKTTLEPTEWVARYLTPYNMTPSFIYYSSNDSVKAREHGKVPTTHVVVDGVSQTVENTIYRKFHVIWVLEQKLTRAYSSEEIEGTEESYVQAAMKAAIARTTELCAADGEEGFDPAVNDLNRIFFGAKYGYEMYNEEPLKVADLPWFADAQFYTASERPKDKNCNAARELKRVSTMTAIEPTDVYVVDGELHLDEILYDIWALWRRFVDNTKHVCWADKSRTMLYKALSGIRWGTEEKEKNSTGVNKLYELVYRYFDKYGYDEDARRDFDKVWAHPCKWTVHELGDRTLAEYLDEYIHEGKLVPINREVQPVEQADEETYEFIEKYATAKGVKVLSAPTGVGKTYAAIQYILNYPNDYVYVVPTYRLASDFKKRLESDAAKAGKDVCVKVCPQVDRTQEQQRYIAAGLYYHKTPSPERNAFNTELRSIGGEAALGNKPTSSRVYVMVHAYFKVIARTDIIPSNTVCFIDEEMTGTYGVTYRLTPDQMDMLYSGSLAVYADGVDKPVSFTAIAEAYKSEIIENGLPTTVVPVNASILDKLKAESEAAVDHLLTMSKMTDAAIPFGFFNSEEYVVSLQYTRDNPNTDDDEERTVKYVIATKEYYPTNQRILVMTATPSTAKHEALAEFNNIQKPTTYTVKPVANKGNVVWAPMRGLEAVTDARRIASKVNTALENYDKVISQLVELGRTENTMKPHAIMYKKWGEAVKKYGDVPIELATTEDGEAMYHGNTAGYDSEKGNNIMVLGTLKKPLYVYVDFYYTYLYGTIGEELEAATKDVLVHGRRTKTIEFNVPAMTRMRLEDMQAEAIQAIGRARANRTDANVVYYGNIPIPDIDYVTYV